MHQKRRKIHPQRILLRAPRGILQQFGRVTVTSRSQRIKNLRRTLTLHGGYEGDYDVVGCTDLEVNLFRARRMMTVEIVGQLVKWNISKPRRSSIGALLNSFADKLSNIYQASVFQAVRRSCIQRLSWQIWQPRTGSLVKWSPAGKPLLVVRVQHCDVLCLLFSRQPTNHDQSFLYRTLSPGLWSVQRIGGCEAKSQCADST